MSAPALSWLESNRLALRCEPEKSETPLSERNLGYRERSRLLVPSIAVHPALQSLRGVSKPASTEKIFRESHILSKARA